MRVLLCEELELLIQPRDLESVTGILVLQCVDCPLQVEYQIIGIDILHAFQFAEDVLFSPPGHGVNSCAVVEPVLKDT